MQQQKQPQRCHQLQQLLKCSRNLCTADRQDGKAILYEKGAERSKVGKAIYSSTGLNILHNFMIITMASTIITMIIILMCARLPERGTLSFIVNIDSGPRSQASYIFIFSESCLEHWKLNFNVTFSRGPNCYYPFAILHKWIVGVIK